jgi:glycoside/pentoside/hexuronide:cation symporter, GPH family
VHWSGLPEKADPATLTFAVVENIMISYAAAVALLAIAGVLVFRHFPLGRDDHEERLRQLAASKENR